MVSNAVFPVRDMVLTPFSNPLYKITSPLIGTTIKVCKKENQHIETFKRVSNVNKLMKFVSSVKFNDDGKVLIIGTVHL